MQLDQILGCVKNRHECALHTRRYGICGTHFKFSLTKKVRFLRKISVYLLYLILFIHA